MKDYQAALRAYQPRTSLEELEWREMLRLIDFYGDEVLERSALGHLTASTFVVNEDASKLLFAYHNQFQAWSFLGGHADGEADLLRVALRELEEETGARSYHPLTGEIDSVEILPVWMHERRGALVPSHLHLNVTYLVLAQEEQPLRVAQEENQAVGWIPAEEMMEYSQEWEMEPTYQKLLARAKELLHKKEL